MSEVQDLFLPEFAFVEGWGENDILRGRNVILHIRSASVIEILADEDILALNSECLKYKFSHINKFCIVENFTAVLHYSATLDKDLDQEMIRSKILEPASSWFEKYLEWEDNNIENGLQYPSNTKK